jgi:anti-anti-sigma factor
MISSLAVGVLVAFQHGVVRRGGQLQLAGISAEAAEVFARTGLDELFEVRDSETDALAEESAALAFPEIEVEERDSAVAVVRTRGATSGDALAQQLREVASRAPQFMVLDLAGLESVDGRALDALKQVRRQMARAGGEVWLAGLRPQVWLALRAQGLDQRFPIYDSVEQAMMS